jgi:hypothetical protein
VLLKHRAESTKPYRCCPSVVEYICICAVKGLTTLPRMTVCHAVTGKQDVALMTKDDSDETVNAKLVRRKGWLVSRNRSSSMSS